MVRTRVGYAGGEMASPTYEDLGDHTEAIEVVYDPEVVSYGALLHVFWDSHNPTYEPFSRQYRSAIFPADPAQRDEAERSMKARQKLVGKRLYTAIEDGARFWTAEDYHQKYRLRHETELVQALADRYPDGSWTDSTAAARLNGLLGGYGYRGELADLGLTGEALAAVEALVEKPARR